MLIQSFECGSVVKRVHPFDGSKWAGRAHGKFLHVMKQERVLVAESNTYEDMILLDDGKWEYPWNLVQMDIDI